MLFYFLGTGTTNDGNTARRFFQNPDITASIVGVDPDLIHRFKIILNTLNSCASVDPEKFQRYCMETAELYVKLYNWYNMPVTVHKVLLHGGSIISSAVLPIGMLTEEAQEARMKDYRQYRLSHSRKCSRKSTNEDVMNFLMASSDPLINKYRANPKDVLLDIHDDELNLLLC